MHDVNWWLMALAFLLGLLLTLALTIRKVTREVPVARTVAAGIAKPVVDKPKVAGAVAAGGAALAGAAKKVEKKAVEVEKKVEKKAVEVEKRVEKVEKKVVAKAVEVEKTVERHLEPDILEADPYGSGSIRVSARKVGPAGYTIKGDKDTGRYFTPDSPDYAEVEAEVWFANEESAAKAGFLRWDAKGDRKVGLVAGAEAVISEKHAGDSSLVIVDDGIAEAKTVIVDDGYADADADLVIVESSPDRQEGAVRSEGAASPYGKGSARAGADGSGPAGWLIKGNADSMLFHGPDSPAYEQTIAEFWFIDEATAAAAGFAKWDKNFR